MAIWVDQVIRGVPEGIRHSTAIRLVGRWRKQRLDTQAIKRKLAEWNALSDPPLSAREIDSTLKHADTWGSHDKAQVMQIGVPRGYK